MLTHHLARAAVPAAAATAALAGVLAGSPGASGRVAASAARSTAAHAAAAPRTVTGRLITRAARTLAPGTSVPSRDLSTPRVFTSATHGVALADIRTAQYPAVSTDGGRTWHTAGPALHLDAAQAPFVVDQIGASGRATAFAWGGGGQVVDVTTDGGTHWYRAVFDGAPAAVVRAQGGRLVAFVDRVSVGTARYVSRNGGRTWRLQPAFMAGG